MNNPFPVLVEVTRGARVESVHHGAAAVVDSMGTLLAALGDPGTVTYLRSSAKPIQVLPFVEAGGVEVFGLEPAELAIQCASHSGSDEHVRVVTDLQVKIGVTEGQLMCGTHPPYDEAARRRLQLSGELPTPNRHNCSGKHTGFLAYARLRGEPLDTYLDPQHPIQCTILQTLAEMSGLPAQNISVGVDGCSAPVFAMPLYHAALAFARLADPSDLTAPRAAACRKITGAMAAHPDMVAGEGRFDTALMRLAGGAVVAKGGAEGYQAIGVLPGSGQHNGQGIGIALKIADGDLDGRARPPVILEMLRQLGVLSQDQIDQLPQFGPRPVTNWRGLEVGELRTAFRLEPAAA